MDWCHKLDGLAHTPDMLARFGRYRISYDMVLVIGRDQHLLNAGERMRFEWRSEHVVVNSVKVWCLTYDDLLNQLTNRLTAFGSTPVPAESSAPPPAE